MRGISVSIYRLRQLFYTFVMFKRLGSYRDNKIKFKVLLCGKQTRVVLVVQNKLTVAFRLKQVSVL